MAKSKTAQAQLARELAGSVITFRNLGHHLFEIWQGGFVGLGEQFVCCLSYRDSTHGKWAISHNAKIDPHDESVQWYRAAFDAIRAAQQQRANRRFTT